MLLLLGAVACGTAEPDTAAPADTQAKDTAKTDTMKDTKKDVPVAKAEPTAMPATTGKKLEELAIAVSPLDWVLYSNWDALVDAFVRREIDLAWNGPLAYLKIKRRLEEPCQVVAMRDVDVDLVTHFITQPNSTILTVEDLPGKSFALARRGSAEAGLLAYHYLKEVGIDPVQDLARFTFFDERQPNSLPDQKDVVELVRKGEYDAGAVSRVALDKMVADGSLAPGGVRIFWSSPGYSHCCFTAQGDLDRDLSEQITRAFVSMDYRDPLGKTAMDAEGCKAFLPGTTEGWETLEKVALEEGLI